MFEQLFEELDRLKIEKFEGTLEDLIILVTAYRKTRQTLRSHVDAAEQLKTLVAKNQK
jgi:hypothetical protein